MSYIKLHSSLWNAWLIFRARSTLKTPQKYTDNSEYWNPLSVTEIFSSWIELSALVSTGKRRYGKRKIWLVPQAKCLLNVRTLQGRCLSFHWVSCFSGSRWCCCLSSKWGRDYKKAKSCLYRWLNTKKAKKSYEVYHLYAYACMDNGLLTPAPWLITM